MEFFQKGSPQIIVYQGFTRGGIWGFEKLRKVHLFTDMISEILQAKNMPFGKR